MHFSIVFLAGTLVFSALSCAPPGKARPPNPPDPGKPANPIDTETGTFGKPRTTSEPSPVEKPSQTENDLSEGKDDK